MKKVLLLLFAMSMTIVSCRDPEPVEIRNITIRDLKTLADNTMQVNTVLRVFNPNSFGAKVGEANLVIYINDKEVGKINNIPEFSLPGKKESEITLPITLNANVVKNAVRKEWVKLFTGKDLKLIIKGDMNASMGMLSRKIPVNHSEDVKNLLNGLL